jgi:ABC-type Zn2+ transport system substrate-binding protein/surface adhesin
MKWALRSYVHDDQVDERNDDDDDHDDDGDDDDEVDATLWLSDGACMRVRVNLHMN